jgi:CxxC-x17-CxxC domain-containing protein
MEFFDKSLTCRDCTNTFLFTAGEQDFYQQKSLKNEPSRCPECRIKRRQLAASGGSPVVGEQPVVLEETSVSSHVKEVSAIVCAECGVETTVPFRPRLSKPVYCKGCFDRQRNSVSVAASGENITE